MRYYLRAGMFKHPNSPKLLLQWFLDWVATTHHNQLSTKDFEGFDFKEFQEIKSEDNKEVVRLLPETEYSGSVISFRKEFEESVWIISLIIETHTPVENSTYFNIEGCVSPVEKLEVAVDPGLVKFILREINKLTK